MINRERNTEIEYACFAFNIICSVDLSSMKLQRAVIYVKIVIVLNVKALKQKVCVMFVASMKL